MLIQTMPSPESNVATPGLAMPDEVASSTSLEQGKVIEKREKKEKNAIAMKGIIVLHIIDRMVQKENAESWGITCTNLRAANLHQTKISKAFQEAQAEAERVRIEVDYLMVASEIQVVKVEHLREASRREEEASMGLKAVLTLSKDKRKKEEEEIGTEREWAVEAFKSSQAMEDIKIAFTKEAFVEGFKIYMRRVVKNFPKLKNIELIQASTRDHAI
ncbi:hypothetical protein COCNU_scaffold004374G000020 [Cocos nucifera]|nr:hypothetical protein [Cocos nucifera]